MSSSKVFKPEGSVTGSDGTEVRGSLGHLGSFRGTEYVFTTNQCQTCYNANVINTSVLTTPIMASSAQKLMVIPHLLMARLFESQYKLEDIPELLHEHKSNLNKIERKWSNNGVNPCKKNHLGYKITLKLKNMKIHCWVIVDMLNEKLAFRLTYGGEDIECP